MAGWAVRMLSEGGPSGQMPGWAAMAGRRRKGHSSQNPLMPKLKRRDSSVHLNQTRMPQMLVDRIQKQAETAVRTLTMASKACQMLMMVARAVQRPMWIGRAVQTLGLQIQSQIVRMPVFQTRLRVR